MTIRRSTQLLVTLLVIHTGLLAWSASRHSPTIDEPAHLASGLSHWHFGRFDLYSVNPPLVRTIAAIPVLFVDHETAWNNVALAKNARGEFATGNSFVKVNGRRSFWLITLARWACIPFSLLGAIYCWLWARQLYGEISGLFAATLWCFSPMILGHGCLITADVPAAALALAAVYHFRQWMEQPTFEKGVLTSIALGIALLSKLSLVVLLALVPVLWMFRVFRKRCGEAGSLAVAVSDLSVPTHLTDDAPLTRPLPSRGEGTWKRSLRELISLFAILTGSVLVLNVGYLGEGTGRRLGEFQFRSAALGGDTLKNGQAIRGNRFTDSWISHLPIPLPENYLYGIDHQKCDFEIGTPRYLLGEFTEEAEGGWWHFYVVTALVKLPVGTIVLLLLALGTARRSLIYEQLFLLTPALTFITLVSLNTGVSHFRYALPAWGFVIVWMSQVVANWGTQSKAWSYSVLTALGCTVVSSLASYPHSIAYLNEAVGGTYRGYRYGWDSSYDWGQDLISLEEWLERHQAKCTTEIVCFGLYDLTDIGWGCGGQESSKSRLTHRVQQIHADEPEWLAVSATSLIHLTALAAAKDDTERLPIETFLLEKQNAKPDDRAGPTILLFRLTDQERLTLTQHAGGPDF